MLQACKHAHRPLASPRQWFLGVLLAFMHNMQSGTALHTRVPQMPARSRLELSSSAVTLNKANGSEIQGSGADPEKLLTKFGASAVEGQRVVQAPLADTYGPTSPTVLGSAGDWLFSVATTECTGNVVYDNTPESTVSRALIPVLLALCTMAVEFGPLGAKGQSAGHIDDNAPLTPQEVASQARPRKFYADFCRICAIMCVVFEHCGGTSYTYRNVGFGLWWALPYLYMTSGMLYTLSTSSMQGYLLRLVAILLVGVSANLAADIASGRNWRGDFANTVFQMWFVVMLMGMAILMDPLRAALRWCEVRMMAEPTPRWLQVWFLACGAVTFGFLMVFVLALPVVSFDAQSDWGRFYAPMLQTLPLILVQTFGCVFLATLAIVQFSHKACGHLGWILLAFIYLPAVAVPFDLDGFPHLLCLYIFSMVATVLPLSGSNAIASAARAYWPFIFMFLCLLTMPDMFGRCDVHPAGMLWERFRFNMGELTMVILFATGALECNDPFNLISWMGPWSLYAYCFHVCWYRLMGSPAAALITFGSLAPFYGMYLLGLLGGSKGGKKSGVR
mmetsp:Transcript_57737/g.137424  ORF Transcript_57737/g.137424 Transcript_57737/m.137424 type:complete len:561 (+) Transcript_57737:85-1767(+)